MTDRSTRTNEPSSWGTHTNNAYDSCAVEMKIGQYDTSIVLFLATTCRASPRGSTTSCARGKFWVFNKNVRNTFFFIVKIRYLTIIPSFTISYNFVWAGEYQKNSTILSHFSDCIIFYSLLGPGMEVNIKIDMDTHVKFSIISKVWCWFRLTLQKGYQIILLPQILSNSTDMGKSSVYSGAWGKNSGSVRKRTRYGPQIQ